VLKLVECGVLGVEQFLVPPEESLVDHLGNGHVGTSSVGAIPTDGALSAPR